MDGAVATAMAVPRTQYARGELQNRKRLIYRNGDERCVYGGWEKDFSDAMGSYPIGYEGVSDSIQDCG
jgi:hypothetical protein